MGRKVFYTIPDRMVQYARKQSRRTGSGAPLQGGRAMGCFARMIVVGFLGNLLLSSAAALAGGLIEPLDQDRLVSAGAFLDLSGGGDIESAEQSESPDYSDWIASAQAVIDSEPVVINATATQNSKIGPIRIFAAGTAEASAGEIAFGFANAGSAFRTRFAVTQDVSYTLTGNLNAAGSVNTQASGCCASTVNASAEIRLERVAGSVVTQSNATVALFSSFDSDAVKTMLDESGTLTTGVYDLVVTGTVDLPALEFTDGSVSAVTTFVITLDLAPAGYACNGDINGDGNVDLADFGLFQLLFIGQ